MADDLEGFSIRSYTAKMRTVDLKNCWPFDGVEEGRLKPPPLPPITVPRYRWWENELEAERSQYSEPDLKNIAASGDDSIVRKQRAPKKRSISELFAAAPQIEVADTSGGDIGVKEVPNIRIEDHQPQAYSPEAGDETVVMSNAALESTALPRKARRIKDYVFLKMSNNRKKPKEKSGKPNSSSVVHTSCSQKGQEYKKFGNKRMGPVDSPKKKSPIERGFSKKQTSRVTQSSKLLAMDHEEAKVFLSRTILKKHSSTKNTTFEANSDNDNLIQPHHQSQKHVTFSRKDEKVPLELPQMQSPCYVFPDVLVASSTIKESKTSCKLHPATVSEEVLRGSSDVDAATVVVESTVSSLSEKDQLDDSQCVAAFTTDTTDRNFPDAERTSTAGTLDLNCAIANIDILDCSEPCVAAWSPHPDSDSSMVRNITSVEEQNCVTGSQANEFQAKETSFITSKCSIERVGISYCSDPGVSSVRNLLVPLRVSGYPVTSSATTTRGFVTQSSTASCLMRIMQENQSGPNILVPTKLVYPWQTRHSESEYNKVVSEKCLELTAARDLQSICSYDQMADGLAWRPLSSQGELMNTYSSGKSHLTDPFKKQHLLNPESCSQNLSFDDPKNITNQIRGTGKLRSIQDDQWKWFPAPPREPEISCYGTRETHDFGRIGVQNQDFVSTDPSFQQEPNLLKSCQCNRKCSHIAKFRADSSSQPTIEKTMRLMGKDVTVGRYNRGGETSDDGKIWSDKEIVAQHSHRDSFSIPCPQRDQSSKNNLQQFEDPTNLADYGGEPQRISYSGLVSTNESHGSNVSRTCHPPPSKEFQTHLPQWLLKAKQEKNGRSAFPLDTDPCQIDAGGSEQETELDPLLSAQKASRDPFDYKIATEKCSSSTPTSLIRSLSIPSIAARRSTPIGNTLNGDKNKNRVGRESSYTYFKLLDKLTRKRLAHRSDDVARQVKKRNIAMLGNTSPPSGPRRIEQLIGCIPCTGSKYQESPDCANEVIDVDMVTTVHEKYGISSTPRSSCLEHCSKLGSVKLSAGAKHVLNPNQNVYRDTFRPIHFTLPSITGTSSTTMSAPQKKDTKVYRF